MTTTSRAVYLNRISTARRLPIDSAFGTALSMLLAGREMSQSTLARKMGKSIAYLNQTMTGVKKAQPGFVDLVADALSLPPEQRAALHQAAAKDKGYKIDMERF